MPEMNEDPAAYWNEVAGDKWVRAQEGIDRWVAPITKQLLEAAAVRSGERVVDVGCGCAETTLALAEHVGSEGRVLGVDISRVMVEHGRRRTQGVEHLELLVADATEHAFEPGWADLVTSRFGVMFFLDPVRAFANLRASLRPGGRLCFACWQAPEHNPWTHFGMRALPEIESPGIGPDKGPTPGSDAGPGPFSLSAPQRIHETLSGAGFTEIDPVSFRTSMILGESAGIALETMVEVGPLSRVLSNAQEHERPELLARVRAFVEHEYRDGPPPQGAGVWIVHARA